MRNKSNTVQFSLFFHVFTVLDLATSYQEFYHKLCGNILQCIRYALETVVSGVQLETSLKQELQIWGKFNDCSDLYAICISS